MYLNSTNNHNTHKFTKTTFILLIVLFLIMFIIFLILKSSTLTTTFYTHESERIPKDFDGFKIVHLSDIHCKNFGSDNQKLVSAINALNPDVIFITGDSIDKYHSDLSPLDNLFSGIKDSAPIYAISGNHECDNPDLYAALLSLYSKHGIIDIDDSQVTLTHKNSSIHIKGLGAFENKLSWDKEFMKNTSPEMFTILLDHYPQLNSLARFSYDIILSGHVHGGIIRLPYIGGLIGNSGNLFPEYSGDSYTLGKSTMYVSRGIGDTLIPRINNNPEIVCITLTRTSSNQFK